MNTITINFGQGTKAWEDMQHVVRVLSQQGYSIEPYKEIGTVKLTKEIVRGDIGINKDELFRSWTQNLGYNKAVLLSCNYDVKKVVEMSEEDAEAEVEAISN